MDLFFRNMTLGDLAAVIEIEEHVHVHPWTSGNFRDALASHYICKVAELEEKLIGYAILMQGVDDAELLDIGISASHHRQGWGSKLLNGMLSMARELGKQRVVLEVRASNVAAIELYLNSGFVEIGLRRDYYQSEKGCREDAILMGLVL